MCVAACAVTDVEATAATVHSDGGVQARVVARARQQPHCPLPRVPDQPANHCLLVVQEPQALRASGAVHRVRRCTGVCIGRRCAVPTRVVRFVVHRHAAAEQDEERGPSCRCGAHMRQRHVVM